MLIWSEARRRSLPGPPETGRRWYVLCTAALDFFFFRQVFRSSKLLWLTSWSFHLSFLIVVVSHLRFFLLPVPLPVTLIQPAAVAAGYILPSSLFLTMIMRLAKNSHYPSPSAARYNFFVLGLLFLISSTGFLMHHYFVPDITEIKEFIIRLATLGSPVLPHDFLFLVHFALVLLLAPFLPTHFFSAPIVILQARRREDRLRTILRD